MKAASVVEIRKALREQDRDELMAHCLRLAKFKKENKKISVNDREILRDF